MTRESFSPGCQRVPIRVIDHPTPGDIDRARTQWRPYVFRNLYGEDLAKAWSFSGMAERLGGKEASDLGWDYRKHMRRLMVFSLSGKLDMPSQPPAKVAVPLSAPFFEVEKDFAKTGADIFGQCAWCHGGAAIAGGLAPDLRTSPIILSAEAFADVVRNGTKRANGMPSYPAFSDSHLKSLQHYIREQADLALEEDPSDSL